MSKLIRLITCPLCRKQTQWENNIFKPFCSERCKMIDLGKWATGDYAVPVEEDPEDGNNSLRENNSEI